MSYVAVPGFVVLGASGLSNSTTARYLWVGQPGTLASTTPVDVVVPVPFKVFVLRYFARLGGASAILLRFNLRKNGGNTGLSLAVLATATAGSASGSVAYDAGDTIGIENTKDATIGGSPTDPVITIGVSPPF